MVQEHGFLRFIPDSQGDKRKGKRHKYCARCSTFISAGYQTSDTLFVHHVDSKTCRENARKNEMESKSKATGAQRSIANFFPKVLKAPPAAPEPFR